MHCRLALPYLLHPHAVQPVGGDGVVAVDDACDVVSIGGECLR